MQDVQQSVSDDLKKQKNQHKLMKRDQLDQLMIQLPLQNLL